MDKKGDALLKNKLIILLIVFLLMSLGYEEVNADIINNYDDINVVAEDIKGINGDIEGKIVADTINCENFGIGNKVEEGTAIYLTDDENSKNVNTNFNALKEQGKVETNVDNFSKEVKENLKEYQQQLTDLPCKEQNILVDESGKGYINGTKYSAFYTNINVKDFNKLNELQFEIGEQEDTKVVVNVLGKDDVYFDFNSRIGFEDNTKSLDGNSKCKNIIYNILEARNIYAKTSVYGTIIAMNSDFTSIGNGHIEGDLFCKDIKLNGSYEIHSGYSFNGLDIIYKPPTPVIKEAEYEEVLDDGKIKIDGNKTFIENDGSNTIEVNNKGKHSDDAETTKITIEKTKDGKTEKSVIGVNDNNEMSIVSNSSDNILVQDNKIEIDDSLELKYKDKSGGFIETCDNTSKAIIIGSVAIIICSLLGIYIIKHKRK